jgi:hypothetical protein
MKRMSVLLLLVALVAAAGCSKKSTPGGPGAATPPSERTSTENAETFTLKMPMTATDIAQGNSQEASIGIDRGRSLDQDVTLRFENLPQGVTIEPAAPVLKRGESSAKVTVRVAPDAAVGNYTAKVVGHPATGPDAVGDFKLDIHAK